MAIYPDPTADLEYEDPLKGVNRTWLITATPAELAAKLTKKQMAHRLSEVQGSLRYTEQHWQRECRALQEQLEKLKASKIEAKTSLIKASAEMLQEMSKASSRIGFMLQRLER